MANAQDEPSYMLIGLQTKDGGTYRAVGVQGSCEVGTYAPKGASAGVQPQARTAVRSGGTGPDPGDTVVVVVGQWVFVTGSEPVVTSPECTGGAPNSSVAMQLLPSTSGGDITRFVVLECSSGAGWIRLASQGPASNVPVPEMFYVDVQGGVIGEPARWDSSVPGAQELDDSIDAARAIWGI